MACPQDELNLITALVEAGLVERARQVSAGALEATHSGVENQPTGDSQPPTYTTWVIENFSEITSEILYSRTYELHDHKWRIVLFPMGYRSDVIAMFLEVLDSSALRYGWTNHIDFSLAIVNQVDRMKSVRRVLRYQSIPGETDWGSSFMPRAELLDPSRGYLVNDTCVVEAEVLVYKAPDLLHDSKKETGFVGLKNQGATCYMNSLLQTLYHIPFFRKVVYSMPTNDNDMPSAHIPLALQRLFRNLQNSNECVVTEELTKSFGWDTEDAFQQHDVQEFNRMLCEKLEEKMKGTAVEGSIQRLFEGHIMTRIACINVNYGSSRTEPFLDLQLDVKGCQDVYASFDKYTALENLDGDNKYQAESHGFQDARKRVLFTDFPPVLQLHLKRFEYDVVQNVNVKINDRYGFPLQLDLDRDDGKYLSPHADRKVRNLYTLHSVLVHSGGGAGGHYFVFIRPSLASQWYKFDDERVTKEDTERALHDMYGGEENSEESTGQSNAYMLVYIREHDMDTIMCVDKKDSDDHLTEKLKSDLEEKEPKKKEKAEANQDTIIKVACDEDFRTQIGNKVFVDLVDHGEVRRFPVLNLTRFNVFKEDVAKEFCVPPQYLRFWLWIKRGNNTYRPFRPLIESEEGETVGDLSNIPIVKTIGELRLFLEFKIDQDLGPVPLPILGDDDILLFFKLYDPVKEELRYVGRLFLKTSDKPIEILPRLKEMAGFAPDEDVQLYEETVSDSPKCDYIDLNFPLTVSLLEDGDIICMAKRIPEEACMHLPFPDPPSFFKNIRYRQRFPVPASVKSMKIG